MQRIRFAFIILLLLGAPLARAFDVTSCHQTVPDNQTGILLNDLVCDGTGGPDVDLGRGATFLMNGHSISGGYIGVATIAGGAKATIRGPGEIFGVDSDQFGGPFGCAIAPSGKLVVRDVDMHDSLRGIVNVYDFAIKLENVTITDNAFEGMRSLNGGTGPGNSQIIGRGLTVARNGGSGIMGYGALKLRDASVTDNGGAGIESRGRVTTLRSVSVTGNAGAGLLITSLRPGYVKDSTLTGNGAAAGDVAAPVAPKFIASTCGGSVDTDSGGTLGICTGD